MLRRRVELKNPNIHLGAQLLYLDQHFSFLNPELTVSGNLYALNPALSETEWRNPGQLRIRGDKAPAAGYPG